MRRGQASPVIADAAAGTVEIRALGSAEEFAACVRLQRVTWGTRYVDCVPASLLKVSQFLGGLCAGAFDDAGCMVGFVYGMAGLRQGRLVHWSHMLAVAPSHRDRGIGRQLKEYQREVVRGQGIEAIYWTFDPLVARNAHLNINRLGAVVEEYVPDMYGATGSRLHAFGTDRFVASVRTLEEATDRPEPGSWRRMPLAAGTVLRPARLEATTTPPVQGEAESAARVEVPRQIEELSLAEARRWRESTRAAFSSLMAEGYQVSGFCSDGGQCFYVLERPPLVVQC
jgi:predicted GNAT superfamily acetyltransferase